jgi:signal transduction histidine kinase
MATPGLAADARDRVGGEAPPHRALWSQHLTGKSAMITAWLRELPERPRVVDAALLVLLCANAVPGSLIPTPEGRTVSWPAGAAVTCACALVLPWRRGRPRTIAVLTGIGALAVTALGYLPTVLLYGPLMIALFALADRTDRRTANTYAFTTIALLVTTAMIADPAQESIGLKAVGPVAWLVLPLALGTTARTRREYLAAMRERAEFAEHSREEEARHRVAEERMRIARELHDVVAHHLALANAQAGTAAHLARRRPEQARDILAELSATTSTALRELKAAVGLLRQSDDPRAPLHPVPGLGRLPELTGSFGAAGLNVEVVTEGEPRPLSPGVDLTAYRIVQEALTNVAKHARAKAATVTLAYEADRLTVTVTNDADDPCAAAPADPLPAVPPPGAATPGGGFGLISMRERARSVGGGLRAGLRPEGGYEVAAVLPVHSRTPAPAPAEESRR